MISLPEVNLENTKQKIIKFIKEQVGDAHAIIGMSGGIDSALCGALCVEALGNEKIKFIMMPSGSSPPEDVKYAILLAEKLNVQYKIINIQKIFEMFLQMRNKSGNDRIIDGNLKARIRMIELYDQIHEFQKERIIGTSNKTEMMLGYFTKHGDGGSDLEPIGCLYKTYVRQLASYITEFRQLDFGLVRQMKAK